MTKKKLLLFSGSILILTQLLYYTRSSVPLDITSEALEKFLAYFGFFNTVFFVYLIAKLSIARYVKVLLGILLIAHGLLLTTYHVRWYADWKDVEVIEQNNNELSVKQAQKLGFDNPDRYRIIRARKVFSSVRIILEVQDVENGS